jgi:hypothetical protein
VRRSAVLLLLLVVAVLAGCGADEEHAVAAPPTLPASALPDLESRARTLDVETVAEDALEPDELAQLLGDAGFVTGSEREFSGRTKTFDHVIARSLRFDSVDGADSYLGWLGQHGDDILGAADPAQVAPLGESSVAYTLARCGTCKKELPTFLAGWRRGEVVLTLLAAGSGGNPDRFDTLARELDAVLG